MPDRARRDRGGGGGVVVVRVSGGFGAALAQGRQAVSVLIDLYRWHDVIIGACLVVVAGGFREIWRMWKRR